MFKQINVIYRYRHALRNSALNDFQAKYRSSIFGLWLAIINPFFLVLIVSFVFSKVFKLDVNNFSLIILSAFFPWRFFSASLSEATISILSKQNILRQFDLPREIIPLSSVLSNFINFIFGFCIAYPLFLFFNFRIIFLFPYLVIIILLHLLFTCGLALILSSVNIFFRDTGSLLEVMLMFWFWVTPVFYSIDMIPKDFQWICFINPATPYIIFYRDVLFYAKAPNYSIILTTFILTIVSLSLGLKIFKSSESDFLKQI